MDNIEIKYVAIYLRKSRGDEETALDKHRLKLTELCKENKWEYVIYEEIVSGDSIAMRPVFINLLSDVEHEIYDGVVVMDIDRLGRGDQSDQATIQKTFINSATYIITPEQIYDLENESHGMMVDFKSFFSRIEYKQIVKRLTQGKKIGSRQGNWTNGTPPFPYEYEKYNDKYNEKGLVVNDEKLKTYRYMVDSLINDKMTPKQIAISLNKMNIKSPRGCNWSNQSVQRLLVNEVHLGKIISNKSYGDGHKNKKPNSKPLTILPKDKWIVVENCHEAVKTQDEHDKILLFLNRLTNTPRRTQKKILPLSGLVKCAKCGHTMGVYERKDRKRNKHTLKPCWYVDDYGNRCGNSGAVLTDLYAFIEEDIVRYLAKLKKKSSDSDIDDKQISIEKNYYEIQSELNNKTKSLERILDAFENGVYTLEQFKDRKLKIEQAIIDMNKKKELLELELKEYKKEDIEEKIEKIESFLKSFENDLTYEELNSAYKEIIDYIKWERNGSDISIKVNYL